MGNLSIVRSWTQLILTVHHFSMFTEISANERSYCIKHLYNIVSCSGSQTQEQLFTCRVDEPLGYEMTTRMTIFKVGKGKV